VRRKETPERKPERILLFGPPGAGKSTAILNLFSQVKGRKFLIDTEDGIDEIWRLCFPNLKFTHYLPETITEFLDAFEEVAKEASPGDWIAIESLARIWDWAQDVAYNEIVGMDKEEFLERALQRAGGKIKRFAPIPNPEMFWPIAKHAFCRKFIFKIQKLPCHLILTSTAQIGKPERFKSDALKELEKFLNFDITPEGWTRSAAQVSAVVFLYYGGKGEFYADVLKDRGRKEGVTFQVKNFWQDFTKATGRDSVIEKARSFAVQNALDFDSLLELARNNGIKKPEYFVVKVLRTARDNEKFLSALIKSTPNYNIEQIKKEVEV
jgi:hypothetical protein